MIEIKVPGHLISFVNETWRYEPNPPVLEWLTDNASGGFKLVRDENIFSKGYDEFDIRIRFETREDAMLFNLTWRNKEVNG